MEKSAIIEAVKKAKAAKKKGKFIQTIDIAVNLKELDISKEEGKINELIQLPHGRSKPAKVCAFVGPELREQASKLCDVVIPAAEFPKWSEARKNKKLAREYDFFIAQANVMPAVAKTFGRFLGVIGKMPNPKFGQIVPPKANIEPLVKRLKASVNLVIKKSPVIPCGVGNEKMSDEQVAENINAILERLKSKLPRGKHNIANVIVKTTMGSPVKIGEISNEETKS